MPLLNLLFNSPTRAEIGALTLDASIEEIHEREAIISDSEIEDGSVISDHVQLRPKGLRITGLVSDSPVGIVQSAIGAGITAVTGNLAAQAGGGILGSVVSQAASIGLGSLASIVAGPDRTPEDAFKYLEEQWELAEPFDVVTALRQYNNMIITSLNVPRTSRIGKSLQFTCEMREIRVVKSSSIDISSFSVAESVVATAMSSVGLGKQAPSGASDSNSSNGSLLFQAFN